MTSGLRATPIVRLEHGERMLALAIPHFWENFPKAIESDGHSITFRLFAPQSAGLHELQGGEQKTHTVWGAFARDEVTIAPLAWCRDPIRIRIDPPRSCASGAVPHLVPLAADARDERDRLIEAAVDGPERFVAKRERIDEYGWRHFGDIHADHESVFHSGPEPFVSHYNNQYDVIAGLAVQFLRTGDERWRALMDNLARHVADIDVYHTDEDKAAYNHGLFWHTAHHVQAGRATHRCFPNAPGVSGGGPSNEHDYTTGLLLHFFLTGEPRSRETVLELARWVIDMDDGAKTPLRWVSRGATGAASSTGDPRYHGPGRGAGNSINALLDGFLLSRDRAYLDLAEELIRRCIHPDDDVAARELGDAERRWSYVVFLQVLGRYLDFKIEADDLDAMYAHARAALLRYAEWMLEHERPFLERAESLVYPTETWAAQDIRKSDVFCYAAMHTTGAARARFIERAEHFYRYSVEALAAMPTRSFTRPLAILLSNGRLRSYLRQRPDMTAPAPPASLAFSPKRRFVPQRREAIRRLATLVGTGAVIAFAVAAALVVGR